MANSLTLRHVDAGYGSVRVLHDVSIRVDDGETVVLLGTNGNGKSTLMKCITGHLIRRPRHDQLEADGAKLDLVGKTPEAIVDLGIALVPEGRRLFPALSVEENLMLGAYRPAARRQIAPISSLSTASSRSPQRRRQPAGQHERRRAADGGARPRADVGAEAPADRRALGRPRPDPGQPGDRQDQGAEGAQAA